MRRITAGSRRAYEKSNALLGVDFKVTPSSRRKIEDLALWLAEGDRTKLPETRKLVLELLGEAAKTPLPRLRKHKGGKSDER